MTALLFEPDELRFFSAGADQKLLTTHARGKLEPEDKGRGNNHTDLVTALIWGPGDRLFSGSRDGTIKTWPRVGGVKPATLKDGVGRVVALALVHVHKRPRLVAACDDDTLRFFPLDAAGKIGELSHRVHDAYALARHELSQDDPSRREAALEALAGHGDARAIEIIAEQVGTDADHALRLLAAQLLAKARHPRATPLLERWLDHPDEAVRVAAFQGLREHLGEADLRPIDLALKAEKADVGTAGRAGARGPGDARRPGARPADGRAQREDARGPPGGPGRPGIGLRPAVARGEPGRARVEARRRAPARRSSGSSGGGCWAIPPCSRPCAARRGRRPRGAPHGVPPLAVHARAAARGPAVDRPGAAAPARRAGRATDHRGGDARPRRRRRGSLRRPPRGRSRWRMPTSSRCSRRRPAVPSTPASAGRGAWRCWATPGPSACSSS